MTLMTKGRQFNTSHTFVPTSWLKHLFDVKKLARPEPVSLANEDVTLNCTHYGSFYFRIDNLEIFMKEAWVVENLTAPLFSQYEILASNSNTCILSSLDACFLVDIKTGNSAQFAKRNGRLYYMLPGECRSSRTVDLGHSPRTQSKGRDYTGESPISAEVILRVLAKYANSFLFRLVLRL